MATKTHTGGNKGKKSTSTGEKVAQADKDKAEVDRVHREIRDKWATHNRTEIEFTVPGVEDEDGKPQGEVRGRTVGGRLYLEADDEVVLDQYGTADLRRHLEAAFQAVS